MEKNPYRYRIKITVDILNEVINLYLTTEIKREDVVEIVKRIYEKYGLKPIKGKSTPMDIYDKELSSLYIIGKYGLGLDTEYPDLFNKVFSIEKKLEECINLLISNKYSEARELLKTINPLNIVDSNTLARMLRIPFIKLIFGFISENDFSNILMKTIEAFPEETRTIKSFVKFYIAFKISDMIYRGLIRDKSYKEAYKKALALRIGFSRTVPDDQYVYSIAREVFNIPEDVLNNILTVNFEKKRE
ncbi:MAG: DUF2192 domain-containing protein [Desulfurococcaceae archaeon]|uniref:DUF2192 domain-containing protein n=1 Tax=Staphylothermus marinus TaxID=2280 RepID=A0A7C4D8J6_STAMA